MHNNQQQTQEQEINGPTTNSSQEKPKAPKRNCFVFISVDFDHDNGPQVKEINTCTYEPELNPVESEIIVRNMIESFSKRQRFRFTSSDLARVEIKKEIISEPDTNEEEYPIQYYEIIKEEGKSVFNPDEDGNETSAPSIKDEKISQYCEIKKENNSVFEIKKEKTSDQPDDPVNGISGYFEIKEEDKKANVFETQSESSVLFKQLVDFKTESNSACEMAATESIPRPRLVPPLLLKRSRIIPVVAKPMSKLTNEANKKRQRYNCPMCCGSFYSFTYLKSHINQLHKGKGEKFLCYFCNKVLHRQDSFRQHLKALHFHERCRQSEQRRKINCPYCPPEKNIISKNYFGTHLRTIHWVNPRIFNCYFCFAVFNRIDLLNTHLKENHTLEKKKRYQIRMSRKLQTNQKMLARKVRIIKSN